MNSINYVKRNQKLENQSWSFLDDSNKDRQVKPLFPLRHVPYSLRGISPLSILDLQRLLPVFVNQQLEVASEARLSDLRFSYQRKRSSV